MDKKIEMVFMDTNQFIQAQQEAEKKGEEEFHCPLCGGKARWGRSSYNGHLHCGGEKCGFKLME